MQDTILSPADFVALLNQTLEFAYPVVTIEGELSNFRVAKNRWVYFDLQDEIASVRFFGTVYMLPGPLEDGLKVRVVGSPRLHPRFGFTVNMQSIAPVGEGAIKKAADLLQAKLEAEGLFAPDRKRLLPAYPETIGLIAAKDSAAFADFNKIINERWGGLTVWLADTYVQGAQAPGQIVAAIEHFNQLSDMPEVLVITRGGGSAEDLAAFSDERVVRAVAASRIPTLVAIGHEVDTSLAELAADMRASTPTNAAATLVPDRQAELSSLKAANSNLAQFTANLLASVRQGLKATSKDVHGLIRQLINDEKQHLKSTSKLVTIFDPRAALKRGYAIINKGAAHISKVSQVKAGDRLNVQVSDGKINVNVTGTAKG
jgi:exodeoxyribonuclease VII large subunit